MKTNNKTTQILIFKTINMINACLRKECLRKKLNKLIESLNKRN
jgi:hypothetical protein